MLGTVLRQKGATADALAEFRATITYRPSSAEAHLSLGQLLAQSGQNESAAAAFAEAERLNQRKADAQASTFAVAMAAEKLKAGDTKGAVAALRDAVRLAPDNPQAHYQLALVLQTIGARAEAATHFAEATRLAPYLRPPAGARAR
jgi:tetratricopeptide (TPR) repeat protein